VAPGDYRMKQVDVERSQEFRKCIECFLCQTVCHVVRDHDENKAPFSGPRYFIRAAELDMHPLDARTDRKNYAQEEQGLGYCNITKCCTEVCPEHIKITDNGIIPMKERAVDNKYDPLVWLGRKIFRRDELAAQSAAPVGVVGQRAPAAGAEPEVGPDGKLPVSEVLFDRPGAGSPFGDNVTFPLPPESLAYEHPTRKPDPGH
jgi:succinate dehydrogenase / fumarate reductase iron-sulfur subunit